MEAEGTNCKGTQVSRSGENGCLGRYQLKGTDSDGMWGEKNWGGKVPFYANLITRGDRILPSGGFRKGSETLENSEIYQAEGKKFLNKGRGKRSKAKKSQKTQKDSFKGGKAVAADRDP